MNDLVTKFERILGSDYFTVQPREVAPEPKSSQTQPQFHPEPIQNARSGHLTGQYNIPASFSSGGHGQGVQTNQAQNGHILPHFLAPRPGQVCFFWFKPRLKWIFLCTQEAGQLSPLFSYTRNLPLSSSPCLRPLFIHQATFLPSNEHWSWEPCYNSSCHLFQRLNQRFRPTW